MTFAARVSRVSSWMVAGVAGVACGAGAWMVTRAAGDRGDAVEAAGRDGESSTTNAHSDPVRSGTSVGATVRATPSPAGGRDLNDLPVPPPSTPSRPVIDWDEERDERWAGPVEVWLGEAGPARLAALVPEARWDGARCRARSCTLELTCEARATELCKHAANILVLVDGMSLRVRQEATGDDGVAFAIDVYFPPGDAASLRRQQEATERAYPEVYRRISEYIAILRRESHDATRADGGPL